MVVELLLPVWYLTSNLAAEKCVDTFGTIKILITTSTTKGDW